MAKRFRWLLDSSTPRRGPKLERNKLHDVRDYAQEVVDEWVKTGAAEYEESPKQSKRRKSKKEE